MFSNLDETMKFCAEKGIRMVNFMMVDLAGRWRHLTIPVERFTADTIENGVTGFLFDESTVASYEEALKRAFKVFSYPKLLNAMRCRAMAAPFNWSKAVEPYAELYEQLVAKSLLRTVKP